MLGLCQNYLWYNVNKFSLSNVIPIFHPYLLWDSIFGYPHEESNLFIFLSQR